MVRKLVVNADDLGLTTGVNQGIFEAHDRGIVTSASLMANAPATSDAIRRVRFRPSLGIGAHLMLVDGVPMLPPNRVPTLVDGDERFRPSWKPYIAACLRGRIHTGVMSADSLAGTVRRLRPGVTELMVHPGYVDDALRSHPTRLQSSRAAEVDLLCSRSAVDLIADENVQLVRHDLVPSDTLLPRSFRNAS